MQNRNINTQSLINALTNAGYIAEETTTTRNGIEHPALSVRLDGEPIGVILTVGDDMTPEEALLAVSHAMANCPDINTADLLNPDYLLENAYIAVQAFGTFEEGVLTRLLPRFNDIEACVKIGVGCVGSIKVNADTLKKSGLDMDTIWNRAVENTAASVKVRDLGGVVHEISAVFPDENIGILVATNDRMLDGAGVIACDDVIEKVKATLGGEMYMIPSSRHEVLFIPSDMGTLESLNALVHEVNETQVIPEDRLTDHAYSIR